MRRRDKGKTVVLVTHFMEEAERLCDRVAIVDQGNVIALDTSANLIKGLDVGVTVSFSLDDTSILKRMANIDAIKRIEESGGKVVVYCSDKRGVASVINTLTESDIGFSDLSIKDPALEDIFISNTSLLLPDNYGGDSADACLCQSPSSIYCSAGCCRQCLLRTSYIHRHSS
ncbi:hypothetical protein M1N84_02520 [Dehalococcoidia bacterium]|nr:hypothetical protein [Dehalococcoidia bacterium]